MTVLSLLFLLLLLLLLIALGTKKRHIILLLLKQQYVGTVLNITGGGGVYDETTRERARDKIISRYKLHLPLYAASSVASSSSSSVFVGLIRPGNRSDCFLAG